MPSRWQQPEEWILSLYGCRITRLHFDLIRKSGCLIAAPSANTSGRPSPTEASCCRGFIRSDCHDFRWRSVGIGIESTIIDLTESKPMVLRPATLRRRCFPRCSAKRLSLIRVLLPQTTRANQSSGHEIQALCPKSRYGNRRRIIRRGPP